MKGKRNDFSITFFKNDEKVLFLEYVHDTIKACKWVNSNKIEWTHGNIYERRTRKYLGRTYPDNLK